MPRRGYATGPYGIEKKTEKAMHACAAFPKGKSGSVWKCQTDIDVESQDAADKRRICHTAYKLCKDDTVYNQRTGCGDLSGWISGKTYKNSLKKRECKDVIDCILYDPAGKIWGTSDGKSG